MFSVSDGPIDVNELRSRLKNPKAGAFVCFEGWVRNHNDGNEVVMLEYEIYEELAAKEAGRLIEEAKKLYDILDVVVVHRRGQLKIGDIAVWIGVTAAHRKDAYAASRYIIDEVKHRLPIWKKEYYCSGEAEWVSCCEK